MPGSLPGSFVVLLLVSLLVLFMGISVAVVFWWCWHSGGVALLLLSCPLLVELSMLTLASLLPARSRRRSEETLVRLAVIVPAHNEEQLIERCVQSLQAFQPPGVNLYVVAHNCEDRTAAIAAARGAEVLVVKDPAQLGKACALRHGFAHALAGGADAVVVVDADSVVSKSFLLNMQAALSESDLAVQCVYRVLPARGKKRHSLTSIAFQGFNLVRPAGRERLGLSVGIFGNGFGLRREALERVPYQANSVVEDLEYHIGLVTAGLRVRMVEDATVFGEMPQEDSGSKTQRARWEGGRLLMMRMFPAPLLGGILRGKFRLFEPLLDVLSLPLAMEVQCLILLLLLPSPWFRWYAVAGLLVLGLHFLAAVKAGKDFWGGVAVLLLVPRYILWKLLLLPKILLASRRSADWVRTHRENSEFTSSSPTDALE